MKKNKLLIATLSIFLSSCDQVDIENQIVNDPVSIEEEIHLCTFDFHNQNSTTSKLMAGSVHYKWTPGQTIKVKFLNGDPVVQEKVKEYANQWSSYANIKFKFVPNTEFAEIRIGFKWENDTGSWSTLGKSGDFSANGQKFPTMNFGWLYSNSTDQTYSRVVLHEFGHALGLIHEHQHPLATINWDKEKTYEYYKKNSNLTKEQVDIHVFMKYNLDQTNYTKYDPLSIMHYNIHYSLTTDGYYVKEKDELSPTDKSFINRMYPVSILYQEQRLFENSKIITSPNGVFSLMIRSEKLVIYNNLLERDLWHLSPNIKFNNFSSTNVYAILRGGELLLYKGSVSRQASGDNSIGVAEYITLANSGDIEFIRNNIPVWSLFKGKLN